MSLGRYISVWGSYSTGILCGTVANKAKTSEEEAIGSVGDKRNFVSLLHRMFCNLKSLCSNLR